MHDKTCKNVIDKMKKILGNNGKFSVEKLEVEPVFGALKLARKLAENTVYGRNKKHVGN